MKYYLLKGFKDSLQTLMVHGGAHRMAAERVKELIGDISMYGKDLDYDPFNFLKVTKHGENRIKHCTKYDLSDYCRLIVIKDNGICAICYVGKHSDCDKWLESHKGLILSVSSKNQLEPMYESEDILVPEKRITGISDYSKGFLYKKLGDRYYNAMAREIERTVLIEFEKLTSTVEDEEILEIAYKIEDLKKQNLFFDVFVLLKKSQVDDAKKRIDLYKNEISYISDLSPERITEIVEGDGLIDLSNFDSDLINHLMNTMDYQQWMLFMHPDQSKIVDEDFSGPTKVVGVSGSGKTAIIVRRAIRLAKKYRNEKILVLTLNRSLSNLITELVNSACPENLRENIVVRSFWELCEDYLLKYEPENIRIYKDITWKIKEHIDEIWDEFYHCRNNNNDAKILLSVHKSLLSRGVFPYEYIKQEFDWIRSAFPFSNRDDYYEVDRKGRSEKFDRQYREKIVSGLKAWEEKMKFVGVTDYLGLSTALYKHISKLEPIYRCILIDEEQDFGTVELSLIRKLVKEGENDLFITGDFAQRVSIKHHNYSMAGITIGGRVRKILKNYRNSREILNAAFQILKSNVELEKVNDDDFIILEPEYANFSTNPPLILKALSIREEIGTAQSYLNDKLENNQKGCIAICGFSLSQVKHIGELIDIPVLDGTSSLSNSKVFLSDLEQTKGFEFDSMCIVNCNEGVIPHPNLPRDEWYYDICKLYVAMTRAKKELIISYSTQLSSIFHSLDEYFVYDEWKEHQIIERTPILPTPSNYDHTTYENILDLTGEQFLYTKKAIGISLELQNKLCQLITGISKAENGKTIEWRSIREALAEPNIPNIAQLFGAQKTWGEFKALFS